MVEGILRRAVAVPARWVSHWSGLALWQAHAIRRPRILMYHVIEDADVSPDQFAWHMRFLRRHFEPVGLPVLIDRIAAGTVTGREVAVTFDDGVQNHFNVAWPILRDIGVPATFFVCPGLTESGAWMWRTELRMRLSRLDPATLGAVAVAAGCPTRELEAVMQWTKGLAVDDRRAFQREVTRRTPEFSPPPRAIQDHAPLSWEQMRQMDERLITIGSHTSTHPVLPTLSGDALREEIAGSRAMLEQKLNRTVDLFSYPNGASSPTVVEMARRHYRAAVVARQDLVAPTDDLLTLPRVPGAGPRAVFARRMHRPTA